MADSSTRAVARIAPPPALTLFELDPLLDAGSPGLVARLAAREARRFPMEALFAVCGNPPAVVLAERLGVSRRRLDRARRRGGLNVFEADELAVRAGHHPSAIWPDWQDDDTATPRSGGHPVVDLDPARLRALRTASALSVRALAAAAGLSSKQVTRLELGHARPGPATLGRLARALDAEPAELAPAPGATPAVRATAEATR